MPASSIARAAAEQALDAVRDRDADALAVIVDRHALVEDRLQQLGEPRQVAGAGRVHLEHVAADVALELVGGAERDHLPVVDHRDAIRQAVGLVEVLGGQEQRRAVVDELGDELPEVDARARVEARSSARPSAAPAAGPTRLAPRSSRRRMPPE